MNKFIFFILFLAISLGYLFEVDEMIARTFNPFDKIKKTYINIIVSLQETTEKYFKQVTTIQELQEENKELRPYKILYESTSNELDSILKTVNNPNSTTDQVKFVKVLSYIDFDNFTKVWLDMKKEDDSILGLISQGYAAGIVVNQKGRAKALLNGNEKCNYAIFIGDKKAPGIIHPSKNGHKLIAKYVPIWFDIKKGDEVITSGMDNIFFEGLKVGKVESIKKIQDIQEATIIPYANVLKQKSFFVYKQVKEPKEEKSPKK
ncbi:rod shape-determining protein MreC [Halarcobacter anaerophilus]|jgi:rod shape-determining protein MreC|uniref:Rod shape-determining protein MreC n=1 Tax=Halarcobacter anaerophilus TaxID=877500 RepID=A0A4Q0XY47_9BACT|nr:rod shape-determining protein MreC [Halarcobacter anaerophilus]QDF30290.1 rod shape-determining protein MreC [Halarcobacter anaerophilus]RXJ61219.1 rod shape-determining protein MreC [Halarcobacter anaerophilus]